MSSTTSGSRPEPPPDREALARIAWSDLRQAIWEASQFGAGHEITDYVDRVLHEIESDAP